jgi:tubulin-specific chaperone D
MINHLVNTKIQHWEEEMRKLSGKALSVLSIFNPELVISKYLPIIYENCFSKVLHVRHGALWALSELILGLSGLSHVSRNKKLEEAMKQIHQKEIEILRSGDDNKEFNERFNQLQHTNNLNLISPEMMTNIKNVIIDMENKGLFKGKGGEIMRFGISHFIKCSSLAKLEFDCIYLEKFQSMLEENAKHSKVEIQLSSASALKQLCLAYHNDDDDVNKNKDYVIKSISKLIERSVKDPNVDMTRGYNMLFGHLSRSIILCMQQKLLKTVLSNMIPKGLPNEDAETRKYAVRSQIDMLRTLGLESVDPSIIKQTIENLYKAIADYALDKRGDVGSWVREEAMRSLNILIYELFYNYDNQLLKEIVPEENRRKFFFKFIGTILQQLMEKIDKIRQVAGQILQSFLITFANDLPDFEEKDTLMSIFIYSEEGVEENTLDSAYLDNRGYLGAKFNYKPWRNPSFVFHTVVSLFDSPNFAKYLFTGIISSAGGLTESTVKCSLDVLVKYISALKEKGDEVELKRKFLILFNDIFEENLKEERITVPLMKTMESLLRTNYFSMDELNEQFIQTHSLCSKEISKTKNILKLIS